MDYQRNQLQHGLKMRTENQKLAGLFYLFAALQILTILGGAVLGLLVAPTSLFVSRTENEAFVWIALGFVGFAFATLGVILLLLSIVAAIGFRNEKKWRKVVGIITAGLAILEFPLGTVLGGFLLWKTLRKRDDK